jgi:hypothetical protein
MLSKRRAWHNDTLFDLCGCPTAVPSLQPKPDAAQQALQQISMAVVTAVPIALQAAMNAGSFNQAPDAQDANKPRVSAGDIAAAREIWSNQASSYDRLTCAPFNGHPKLLSERPSAAAEVLAQQLLADAAVAVNASHAGFISNAVVQAKKKAAAGDVAAVSWDGKNTLGATFYPAGPLAAADVALAGNVMSDVAGSLMPWMWVQVGMLNCCCCCCCS